MKKPLSLLLFLVLLAGLIPAKAAGPAGQLKVRFYNESTRRYEEETVTDAVRMVLDGAPLSVDVPGVVQYPAGSSSGRTLVPVRTVAEPLGAEVLYVETTRQVILVKGSDTIVLTLGSSMASVNGEAVPLPDGIPAGVVKYQNAERTMVPLRFVSERLGAQVAWDGSTFTASITQQMEPSPAPSPDSTPTPSPDPTPVPPPEETSSPSATPIPTPEPTPIPPPEASFFPSQTPAPPSVLPPPSAAPTPSPAITPPPAASLPDRGKVLRIESDDNAQTIFIATDHIPEMRVLDFGDRIAVDIPGAYLSENLYLQMLENTCISLIRYAEHPDDLGYGYAHTVRLVLDLNPGITYQNNIKISQQIGGILISTFDEGTGGADYLPTVPLDPDKLTIVLDAGHGGSASGAAYEDIMEKDLTLPMTKKLQSILLEKGYNVVMTREDDSYVDLYDRADIANAVQADVFVSIHCNAAPNSPNFQGLYTYYHPTSGRGKKLAQFVQQATAASTGAINRGISNNDYVVLRETDMCAVLVETGFMSCHEELMRLCDSTYQQKLAEGIAEGVVQYLNSLSQPGNS